MNFVHLKSFMSVTGGFPSGQNMLLSEKRENLKLIHVIWNEVIDAINIYLSGR